MPRTRVSRLKLVTFLMLLLLNLLTIPQTFAAQNTVSFVRVWGGASNDYANGVATDSFGHVYVAGSTDSFGAGGFDVFLLKYAASGNLLWQRTWGGSGDDYAAGGSGDSLGAGRSVGTDSAGNVYVAGSTYSFGDSNNHTDSFLLKFDSLGNILWQKKWGGGGFEWTQALALDPSGNVYVTGFTDSFGAGQDDVFLLKFNSTGDLQWQQTWGGSARDEGFSVVADSSGNIYVGGYTQSFGMQHAVLLKFDSAGNLQWQRTWGGNSADIGRGVAADTSGDIYMTGSTGSFATPTNDSADQWDVFLLKFNSTGNLLWQTTWGGTGFDHGNDVAVGTSGSVYVTGVTSSADGGVFLLKFDHNENLQQQLSWGPSANDGEGRGIALDSAGNAFVTGIVGSPPPAPYLFNSTSLTTQTPPGILGTSGNSTGSPPFPEHTPGGIVMTPIGSQTYAGGVDAFLFEYGGPLASSVGTPLSLALIASLLVIPLVFICRKSTEGSYRSGKHQGC